MISVKIQQFKTYFLLCRKTTFDKFAEISVCFKNILQIEIAHLQKFLIIFALKLQKMESNDDSFYLIKNVSALRVIVLVFWKKHFCFSFFWRICKAVSILRVDPYPNFPFLSSVSFFPCISQSLKLSYGDLIFGILSESIWQ